MKITKPLLCGVLVALPIMVMSQEENTEQPLTLTEYVDIHPNCLTHEVIYEGCTLKLNCDGDYLFGQFTILHPELQMRILMKGITFYVDPTGKKKEKYTIHFPAASAVENVMSQMAPPEPGEDVSEDVLPDIRPLIAALAHMGVEYEINRKPQQYESDWSSINMDESTHSLSYTFIIPVEQMLSEKKLSSTWKFGLYSEGGRPTDGGPSLSGRRQSPGMMSPGMGGPGMMGPGMMGPGMMGPGNSRKRNERDYGNSNPQVDLRKLMMNDIEVWIPFSFEEICSLEQNNNEE